jgi:hypothetical protein
LNKAQLDRAQEEMVVKVVHKVKVYKTKLIKKYKVDPMEEQEEKI